MGATEPATSQVQQAFSHLVFYEKFDELVSTNIDGQNGWSGNCIVADDTESTTGNKYLKCRGFPDGTYQGAQRNNNSGLESSGSYYMQFDVWPNVNVVDSTHGKLFIEGPQGAVFQIIVGCDNIRGAFGYYGNTTRGLLNFACNKTAPPPRYRVVCTWQSSGTSIRCGASQLPNDPTVFVDIPAIDGTGKPEPILPFDHVRVLGGIGGRAGATLFDKIYLEAE
jgi:hypothetical protein